MGLVSVFGSDIDTFYNKLLEGESGISLIDRFDASKFPVQFAGQIRNFSSEGYIDGKNDRRLDDTWRYCLVGGKRALEDANLGTEVLEKVSQIFLAAKCSFPVCRSRLNYPLFQKLKPLEMVNLIISNFLLSSEAQLMKYLIKG